MAHFGNLSLRCLAKWGFVVIWDLGPQLLASQEKHLNMCRDILVKIYDIKHKLFPFMYSLLTFCYTFWLFHDVRKFCVFFWKKKKIILGSVVLVKWPSIIKYIVYPHKLHHISLELPHVCPLEWRRPLSSYYYYCC